MNIPKKRILPCHAERKLAEVRQAQQRLKKFTDLRPTLNPDIGGRRIKATPTLDQYDRTRDE